MACKRFLERISVFKGQSKRGATYLFHLLRSYNAYYTFWQQIFECCSRGLRMIFRDLLYEIFKFYNLRNGRAD